MLKKTGRKHSFPAQAFAGSPNQPKADVKLFKPKIDLIYG